MSYSGYKTWPLMYCALDSITNTFYFVNNSGYYNPAPDGVINVGQWGNALGPPDYVVTGKQVTGPRVIFRIF